MRVFLEGIRGNKEGHKPIWIVEYWNPWKYYTRETIDWSIHKVIRKIPLFGSKLDDIWDRDYYSRLIPENTKIVEVTWEDVDKKWHWAKK